VHRLAETNHAEVVNRIPTPAGTMLLLDVGGACRYDSVQQCPKNPSFLATTCNMPQAFEHAARSPRLRGTRCTSELL
jgi:hypothetical protein